MAQFNTPPSPNSMSTPDDRTLSAEFKENKLENQKNIALDIVEASAEHDNGFDEFFEHDRSNVTVDGFKGFGRLNRVSSVVTAVNQRVLEALGNFSVENQSSNHRISTEGNIDGNIWSTARLAIRGNAERRINETFENANYSESILIGQEQVVNAAENKLKEESSRVNEEQQICKDRKRLLGRALDNPVCNALRISNVHTNALRWFKGSRVGKPLRAIFSKKARYERFQEKFDTKLTERFAEIKKKLTAEKVKATKRKEQMKSRITRTINGVQNIEEKNELWNAVEEAATTNGGTATPALLQRFRVNTGLRDLANNTTLFWESLQDLPELKESIFSISSSREKYRTQNEILDSAEQQENKLRTAIPDFHDLDIRISGAPNHIPVATTVPDKKVLIANLERDLQRQGVNLHTSVYDSYSGGTRLDMFTSSLKLCAIVQYLSTEMVITESLSNESLSELRGWIKKESKKAIGNTEVYDNADAISLKNSLFPLPPAASGKLLDINTSFDGIRTGIQDLERVILTAPASPIGGFGPVGVSPSYNFITDLVTVLQTEKNRVSLSVSGMKNLPEKDKNYFKQITDFLESAEKEARSTTNIIQDFGRRLTHYKSNFDSASKSVDDANALPAGTPTEQRTRTNAIHSADVHLRNIKAQQPAFSYPQSIVDLQMNLGNLLVSGPQFEISDRIELARNTGINAVIRNELLKDFSKEVEEKYLKHLEANDQFTDLEKCSEGMNVKISYCEVSGIDDLHMPQQIHENNNNHVPDASFRILKKIKNEDGTTSIMLTSRRLIGGVRKIITINSGAVTNGKPNKNGVIQTTVNMGTPGAQNPTNPMHGGAGHHIFAYNFQIGQ